MAHEISKIPKKTSANQRVKQQVSQPDDAAGVFGDRNNKLRQFR